jgi:hypothetical protein
VNGPARKHVMSGTPHVAKPRRYPEAAEQMKVVAWARAAGWLVERIENAAKRRYGASRDVAMGMMVGSYDLLCTWKDNRPFRLEMKSATGRVSLAQAKLGKELDLRRQPHGVAFGSKQGIALLREYAEACDRKKE